MSFFDGTIYSDMLEIDTRLSIILPQDSRNNRNNSASVKKTTRVKPKTLILLHGLTDNAAAWWMRTSIIRYAEQYGFAVIMPQADKSFYNDMVYGDAYFKYITDELPVICADMFNISFLPADLIVAGLSMGGYGALKCAMTYPERYSACGAFSSAWDIRGMAENLRAQTVTRGFEKTFQAVFGATPDIPDQSDLCKLAELNNERFKHLNIYMSCGLQDGLLESNQRLAKLIGEYTTSRFRYEEWEGDHQWDFWDESIKRLLQWLK